MTGMWGKVAVGSRGLWKMTENDKQMVDGKADG